MPKNSTRYLRCYRSCLSGLLCDLYKHKNWRDLEKLYYFNLDFIVREHGGNKFWPILTVMEFVKLLLQYYPFLYDPTTLELKSVHEWLEKKDYCNIPYDALLALAGAVYIRKIRKFLRGAILACKGYYDNLPSY